MQAIIPFVDPQGIVDPNTLATARISERSITRPSFGFPPIGKLQAPMPQEARRRQRRIEPDCALGEARRAGFNHRDRTAASFGQKAKALEHGPISKPLGVIDEAI